MISHYQILRMTPENDVQGKSEAEIIKRVNNNYKILLFRAEVMYPDVSEREKALQQAKEAFDILSDPIKREAYLEEHKRILQEKEDQKVYVTYILTDDETIDDYLNSKNDEENSE